ncbi:hypothetical protein [Massilia scottii]|uniref:hypothetical protein n=1 Tax=Massilia scottii TaxID=3057166 RepID=UPI0027968680|nr:hypothetical protein [Massilia sp. CCM 9029]MDQ1831952.1 hypothetical protein [Massilia sp. CCM 9029]
MFYAILPTSPAVFLVQPDSDDMDDAERTALLADLSFHFMSKVALTWWDEDGKFFTCGYPCTGTQALDEALTWREFALRVKNSELPF